jgi:hypothetical protein
MLYNSVLHYCLALSIYQAAKTNEGIVEIRFGLAYAVVIKWWKMRNYLSKGYQILRIIFYSCTYGHSLLHTGHIYYRNHSKKYKIHTTDIQEHISTAEKKYFRKGLLLALKN